MNENIENNIKSCVQKIVKSSCKSTLEGKFASKGEMIYLVAPNSDVELSAALTKKINMVFKEEEVAEICSNVLKVKDKGIVPVLLQCAVHSSLGFDITTDSEHEMEDFLFGKQMALYLLTASEDDEPDLLDIMFDNDIPVMTLGHVTKGELRIDDESYGFIKELQK